MHRPPFEPHHAPRHKSRLVEREQKAESHLVTMLWETLTLRRRGHSDQDQAQKKQRPRRLGLTARVASQKPLSIPLPDVITVYIRYLEPSRGAASPVARAIRRWRGSALGVLVARWREHGHALLAPPKAGARGGIDGPDSRQDGTRHGAAWEERGDAGELPLLARAFVTYLRRSPTSACRPTYAVAAASCSPRRSRRP